MSNKVTWEEEEMREDDGKPIEERAYKGIEAHVGLLAGGRLYVKRPLPIQAIQINQAFWVETLEGTFQAKEGDYLIRGIKGELYACDKEIFEKSYELLNKEKP